MTFTGLYHVSMATAEALKAKEDGNGAFAARDYSKAIYCWAKACAMLAEACPRPFHQPTHSPERASIVSLIAVLHANTAEAYLQMTESRYQLALNSADLALSYDPTHAKAHARRARALLQLGLRKAAQLSANKAAGLDPVLKKQLAGELKGPDDSEGPQIALRTLHQDGDRPAPRWHATLTLVGDQLLMLGGWTGFPPAPEEAADNLLGKGYVELFACVPNTAKATVSWRRIKWRPDGRCVSRVALNEPPPGLNNHTAVLGEQGTTLLVFGGEVGMPGLPQLRSLEERASSRQASSDGRSPSLALDGLYEFTPNTHGGSTQGSWRRLGGCGASQIVPGAWPVGRSGHVAARTSSHMWIFGGVGAGKQMLDDTWRFELASGTWEEVMIKERHRPPARAFASSVYDSSTQRWYIFGGSPEACFDQPPISDARPPTYFSDVWVLDVTQATPRWMIIFAAGDVPADGELIGRAQATAFLAAAQGKPQLCLFGGYRPGPRYYSALHALSIPSDMGEQHSYLWQLMDCSSGSVPLPLGRCGASSCVLDDGQVVLGFGSSDAGMRDDLFLCRIEWHQRKPQSTEPPRPEEMSSDKAALMEELQTTMRVSQKVTTLHYQAQASGGHGGARFLADSHKGIAFLQSVGTSYMAFMELYQAAYEKSAGLEHSQEGSMVLEFIASAHNETGLILKWLGRFKEAEAHYLRALNALQIVSRHGREREVTKGMKQIAGNLLAIYKPANLTPAQEAGLNPRGDRPVNDAQVAACFRIAYPEMVRQDSTDSQLAGRFFGPDWLECYSQRVNSTIRNQMTSQGIGSWREDTIRWQPATCRCGKVETAPKQFKRCAGCRRVTYCSAECQTAHWKASHKHECRVWAAEGPVEEEEQQIWEHLPDEPAVSPLARLLAEMICGMEDAAIAAVSAVPPSQLLAVCFPGSERTRYRPLDVAHLLGLSRTLRAIADAAGVEIGNDMAVVMSNSVDA